jgi:small subunit ribosomal protein S16
MRRMGKKRQHYFRMVVADQRAKRDGGFLETLGSYDPHANPPAITLNEESAREWIRKGAQPSEAAEKVLRRAGVIGGSAAPRKQVEPAAVAVAEAPKVEAAPAAAPKAEAAPAAAPAVAVAEAPKVEAAPAAAPEAAAATEAAPAEATVATEAPAEAEAEPAATAEVPAAEAAASDEAAKE